MNSKSTAEFVSLQHKKDEKASVFWSLWRVFGRFYWARRALGRLIGIIRQNQLQTAKSSIFPNLSTSEAVIALQDDAIAFGCNLPSATVAAINTFAHATALVQESYVDRDFCYKDCETGYFSDGAPIPLAYAKNARLCPEVMAIVNDPVILEIATRYLGFRPKYFRDRLWFSFAGNYDLGLRRKMNQTVEFHFDLPGSQFTFFYASFYLSDVDEYSGAHSMIKGSHRLKPLSMKLCRSRCSEEAIHKVYGRENEIIIKGKAGTGFFEDASCYHRALAPTQRERLMLQIRYF
jgi:hypothetical protein